MKRAPFISSQQPISNKKAAHLLKEIYKSKYVGKTKNVNHDGSVQRAFDIYHHIEGNKTHFALNSLISLCLHFHAPHRILSIWDDIKAVDDISPMLLLKCCAQSDTFTIGHVIWTLKQMHRLDFSTLSVKDRKSYSMSIRSVILSKCQSLDNLQQIHSLIDDKDIFIKTALITRYGQFNDTNSMHTIFLSVPDHQKDTVFIGAMMNGLFDNGKYTDVLDIYQKFSEQHNDVLRLIALKACIESENEIIGNMICTQILEKYNSMNSPRTLKTMDIKLKTTMIDYYGHFGDIDTAKSLFESLNDNERNTVSLNAMMKGLVHNHCNEEALSLFDQFQGLSNEITHIFALKACINLDDEERGRSIHRYQIKKQSVELKTTLIAFYGHFGDIESAENIFNSMADDTKTIITITEMMHGFVLNERYQEAIELFQSLNSRYPKLRPDVMCYVNVLKACTESTCYPLGLQIHEELRVKQSILRDSVIVSALIMFYGKCGKLKIARELFDEMKHKDAAICNAMISAYGRNGEGSESQRIYREYFGNGIGGQCQPDRNTFIYLMSSCNHSGLSDYALQLWSTDVAAVGLQYDSYLVTTVIDCLSRRGELQQSYNLILQYDKEKKCDHRNDELMWIGLLSGCRLHGDTETAQKVFDEMKRRKFSDFAMSKAAVLMRNLYGVNMKRARRSGEGDGSHQLYHGIRDEIEEKGWSRFKTPGISEIYINGKLHTFYAGNEHLKIEEYKGITEYLGVLVDKLKDDGYHPDMSVVTRELKEGEKAEDIVLRHSEKLAVIYGLMKTKTEEEIVINKNLRICSDCHSFMKALSKVTDRVLTISDSYRVHQFRSGSCSCREYY